MMLTAASQLPLVELILKAEETVPENIESTLTAYIERRARREPLQHILGESYFMGLRFKVSPAVLIPRPETEVLVEHAAQTIGRDFAGRANILDIGAGSGAICLSLLKNFPDSRATAYEIDPEAAAVCLSNAESLGVAERLTLFTTDFLTDIGLVIKGKTPTADAPTQKFDIFVSNPPYIQSEQIETLAPEVKDYEPHLALVGLDSDGLGFYRAFARNLPALASVENTQLYAEFGYGQGDQIRRIFEEANWQGVGLLRDLSGLDRVLKAGSPKKTL